MTTFKTDILRKMLSFSLLVSLALTMLTVGGFSAAADDAQEEKTFGAFKYTVSTDGVCITEYTGEGLADVSIPDTIDDTPVVALGQEAFWYCKELVAVKLPEYLEFIGARAFQGCENLEYAQLPDSVEEIGDAAFDGCTKLAEVTLPSGLLYVGGFAFDGTQYIKKFEGNDSIILSGRHFYKYSGSSDVVNIPEGVQSISSSAFAGNTKLSYVSIPESVLFIGNYAFFNCPNLKSANIPDKVYYMGAYSFGYTSVNADGTGDIVDDFVLYATKGTLGDEYANAYELECKDRKYNPTPDEMPDEEKCVANQVDETKAEGDSRWLGNTNSVVALVIIIVSCTGIIGGLYVYFAVSEKKRKAALKEDKKNLHKGKKSKKK